MINVVTTEKIEKKPLTSHLLLLNHMCQMIHLMTVMPSHGSSLLFFLIFLPNNFFVGKKTVKSQDSLSQTFQKLKG